VGQVEQVHALVDQLATARALGLGAPLALVAEAPTVSVTPAQVHQLPVPSGVDLLGGAGDPATRLENRLGEPAANPYLFIASQIVSGLDGIERKLDPGPQDEDAYSAKRSMLPTRLTEALDALNHDALFRRRLGDTFVDYYLKLKGNEAVRFGQFLEQNRIEGMPEEPTAWEQNEYFDFF